MRSGAPHARPHRDQGQPPRARRDGARRLGQHRPRRRARASSTEALDAGINLVDTADVYAVGESEEIVGGALARSPRRRRARHQVPRPDGRRPQPPGQLAPLDHAGRRGQPAPAGHRPHRPVPGPPARPGHRHRGDDRRPRPTSCARARSWPGARRRSRPTTSSRRAGRPSARRRRRPAQRAAAVLDPAPGHRARRAAGVPALRHRRARVEPAGRRLADRQVPPRRAAADGLAGGDQPRPLRRRQRGQVRRRRAPARPSPPTPACRSPTSPWPGRSSTRPSRRR